MTPAKQAIIERLDFHQAVNSTRDFPSVQLGDLIYDLRALLDPLTVLTAEEAAEIKKQLYASYIMALGYDKPKTAAGVLAARALVSGSGRADSEENE